MSHDYGQKCITGRFNPENRVINTQGDGMAKCSDQTRILPAVPHLAIDLNLVSVTLRCQMMNVAISGHRRTDVINITTFDTTLSGMNITKNVFVLKSTLTDFSALYSSSPVPTAKLHLNSGQPLSSPTGSFLHVRGALPGVCCGMCYADGTGWPALSIPSSCLSL